MCPLTGKRLFSEEFLFWTFLRSSPFYGSGVNKLIRAFMVYKRVEALKNRMRNEERQFWQMAFLAVS